MRFQLFSFISVAVFVSFVSATGCNKCLNQNEDNIRLGCFNKCKGAFNPSSYEYRICRNQCTEFVFQDHCCTSSCRSEPNVCLNDYFQRTSLTKRDSTDEKTFYQYQLDAIRKNPDLLDKRAMLVGDAPYHLIRSTEDLKSLNHPDLNEIVVYDMSDHSSPADLHHRETDFNFGKLCCSAIEAVIEKGLKDAGGNFSGNTTEEQQQGLVLVSFAVAGAYACSFAFQMQCLRFNARPPAPN